MSFDRQKEHVLSKVDLSRKGSVDAPIVDLCQWMNQQPDLVTLSSCSGRVLMLREAPPSADRRRKAGCEWLAVCHDPEPPEFWVSTFENRKPEEEGCVVLKFEAFLLHVQCRSLEVGQWIAQMASEAGFRNTGMTISKAGKIVVAVRSTHGMEVPLTDDAGESFVSPTYLEYLVRKANRLMEVNLQKIHKFEDLLKNFSSSDLEDCEDLSAGEYVEPA